MPGVSFATGIIDVIEFTTNRLEAAPEIRTRKGESNGEQQRKSFEQLPSRIPFLAEKKLDE